MGSVTLHGANNRGNAVTQQAKDDLTTAYNDAAGRSPITNVATELGGTTLPAGVYHSPTLGLTGTLTLDAQGDPNAVFIFLADSTLITASNSSVRLIGGAVACNVVWKVGSSATFGTGTQFVGDVLSHTSITAQTAATFEGRLLARTGAVTLDTNTISRPACAGVITTPTPTPTPTPSSTHTAKPTPTPSTSPTHKPRPSTTPTKSPVISPTPSTTTTGHRHHPGGGSTRSPGGGTVNGPPGGHTKGPGGGTGTTPRLTSQRTSLAYTGVPARRMAIIGLILLGLGVAMLTAVRTSHRPRGNHGL